MMAILKTSYKPISCYWFLSFPLKTSENQRFDVLRGYKKKPVVSNGLTHFNPVLCFIQKPVTCFVLQNKWLVSIWNATLGPNKLIDSFKYRYYWVAPITIIIKKTTLENGRTSKKLKNKFFWCLNFGNAYLQIFWL